MIGDEAAFKTWLKDNVKDAILATSLISEDHVECLADSVFGYGYSAVEVEMEIEFYYTEKDKIKANQEGTTFPAKVVQYFLDDFNDSSVGFVVDVDSMDIDAGNVFSMVGAVVTILFVVVVTI
eukprot:UN06319